LKTECQFLFQIQIPILPPPLLMSLMNYSAGSGGTL
jgi:hypothetical protein